MPRSLGAGGAGGGGQERKVPRGDHQVSRLQPQLVLPLQVDRCVLLVRKPLAAHRALEPVFNSTLEAHVPVEVVIPVVTFSTFLALECLLLPSRLCRVFPPGI